MLHITERIAIPDSELEWKFARSGGPGGQNVNKVASKAILSWRVTATLALPDEVKTRFTSQQRRFFTGDGVLMIVSQRHREQERNRQDCLDKLRAMILQALVAPKVRKKTRPTRGSKVRRLEAKRHRAATKHGRRGSMDD